MSTALQMRPSPRLQTLVVRRFTRPSLGRLATTAAPYRGASSDRSCAILKHPLNLKKGFQVSNPIRVAVLGFWHVHADEYAARVREHPDAELVAVWDDDFARGQAAADAAGVPFVHDLDALLARDDLDAVTVTTATTEHHAIMLRVIQAGKHIFTEKLLAPTVAEAEEVIAATDNASAGSTRASSSMQMQ